MKRFNNFRRMLPLALTFVLALILAGCTQVDDTLGGNLIPDNQQMRAGVVRLPGADELNPKRYVETRLYQTDSIIGSNISYGYFGSQLNDTLGRRTAGFLTQIINYYKVDEDYFGYMPIFDSAQILLSVSSFGRDTVTEQTFAVYEILSNDYLTEKPVAPGKSTRDTTFYLGFDPLNPVPANPAVEKVYDPAKKLFTFTLGGENRYPSTTSAVTLKPTEEGKRYIRRLMLQEGDYKDDYSIYDVDNLEKWVQAFKGFYICPDPDAPISEYGKGTIFSTELAYSGLEVYGRNRVKDDPTLIQDTIGMLFQFYNADVDFGNVSVNTIRHDYSVARTQLFAPDEAREPAPGQPDNRPLAPRVFVEGMGGVISEMTFTPEFFAALEQSIVEGNRDGKDFKTLAFSQVRMSIYFDDSDYDWTRIDAYAPGSTLIDEMSAAPSRLGLYTDFKRLTPVADYAYTYEQNYNTTLTYGGKINRSRGCYVMDITAYMQQLWNGYMEAKAEAGASGAIDWERIPRRTLYIGPEAYGLYTTSFGVLQGMATDGTQALANNAPIRFEIAYNLIK